MIPFGDEPNREIALANAAAVGLVLIALALLEFARHQVWVDIGELLLGFWLAGSPRLLGYWTPAGIAQWHQALGGLIVMRFSPCCHCGSLTFVTAPTINTLIAFAL